MDVLSKRAVALSILFGSFILLPAKSTFYKYTQDMAAPSLKRKAELLSEELKRIMKRTLPVNE